MYRAPFFCFLLIGFLLSFAGCQQQPMTADTGRLPADDLLPLTGDKASQLGEAALTIMQQQGSNGFSIVPVSPSTGKPIQDIQPVALGGAIAYGFSRDRSQMVFLSNRSEGCLNYCLRIMDLRNWEEMVKPIPVEKSMSAWFIVPIFDEKSDIIPLILNRQNDTVSEILLVDRKQGSVIARTSSPASIFQAGRTPGGALAVHGLHSSQSGTEPVIYLALLDSKDLHLLWEKTLTDIPLWVDGAGDHDDPTQGQYYDPATAFSHNNSKLFIVLADQPVLMTVDFQHQTIDTVRIQKRASWLERLLASGVTVAHAKTMNGISKMGVLSQDGRYLYVVGQETRAVKNERGEYEMDRIPLGLQVIDIQDGALVHQIETDANQLAMAQDGKKLLLQGWQEEKSGYGRPWTDVVDLTSWKVVQHLEGTAYPSRLLDGSLAWLVNDQNDGRESTITLYRPGDLSPRMQVSQSGYVDWIVIP